MYMNHLIDHHEMLGIKKATYDHAGGRGCCSTFDFLLRWVVLGIIFTCDIWLTINKLAIMRVLNIDSSPFFLKNSNKQFY